MWHKYKNGNTTVFINDEDGTKIRRTEDDEFRAEFPESMDVNITQKCDGGCAFCYAGCTPEGKHADVMGAKFIDSLPESVEVALQVNDLSHPDLIPFLEKLKDKHVFPSITVNQKHFEEKEDLIRKLADEKLIYGLGISLRSHTVDFVRRVLEYPNAVIHTINGVTTPEDYVALSYLGQGKLKILILGYKYKGRGIEYYERNKDEIEANQKWLSANLKWALTDGYKLVSFDNLALEQLHVKDRLDPAVWERYYMGDEGTSSMYIDLVNEQFAVSSLETQMFPLRDDIREMFAVVQEVRKNGLS